jgi:hypothetical protein
MQPTNKHTAQTALGDPRGQGECKRRCGIGSNAPQVGGVRLRRSAGFPQWGGVPRARRPAGAGRVQAAERQYVPRSAGGRCAQARERGGVHARSTIINKHTQRRIAAPLAGRVFQQLATAVRPRRDPKTSNTAHELRASVGGPVAPLARRCMNIDIAQPARCGRRRSKGITRWRQRQNPPD